MKSYSLEDYADGGHITEAELSEQWSRLATERIAKRVSEISEQQLQNNICKLVEKVFDILDKAKPTEWREWSAFSGRTEYRIESVREAQRKALVIFFEELLSD